MSGNSPPHTHFQANLGNLYGKQENYVNSNIKKTIYKYYDSGGNKIIDINCPMLELTTFACNDTLTLSQLLGIYFTPLQAYTKIANKLYGPKIGQGTGLVDFPLWQIRQAYLTTLNWEAQFKATLKTTENNIKHKPKEISQIETFEVAIARVLEHIIKIEHLHESLTNFSGSEDALQVLLNSATHPTKPQNAEHSIYALSVLITLSLRNMTTFQSERIVEFLKGQTVKLEFLSKLGTYTTPPLKLKQGKRIRECVFIDFHHSCWSNLNLEDLDFSGTNCTRALFINSQNLTNARYACFHHVNAERLTFKEKADCRGSHWHDTNLSKTEGKAIVFEWGCFNLVTAVKAEFLDAKTEVLYKGEKNNGKFFNTLEHVLPEKEHSFETSNTHTQTKQPAPDNVMQYAQHRAQWGLAQMHVQHWSQAIEHLTIAIDIFKHVPWLLHLGMTYAAYGASLQDSESQDKTLANQQYKKGIQCLLEAWILNPDTVSSLQTTSPTINEKILGIQDWKKLLTAFTLEHHQHYYTSLCNASAHTDDNPDKENNAQCIKYLNFVKALWPHDAELYTTLLNIPNKVGYRQSERVAYERLKQAIFELANAATTDVNKDTKLSHFRTTPQKRTPNLTASLKTVYQDISIHPDVIATLLDKKGRIRPLVSRAKKAMQQGIKSRHDVMRLYHRGFDIHIKAYPNFPAMDYAIDILNRRLIGHGSVPSTLAALVIEQRGKELLRYPVLISLTEQPGENLQTVLERNEEELLATLDGEAYTDLCLTELLKHPGDGFSRNYVVTTKTHAAGKPTRRLVSVDNDQMFVHPIVKKGLTQQKVAQEKSIIYALPPFASHPMNQQALKRFALLDTDLILEKWLDTVGEMSDKYTSNVLFSKEQQKALFEHKDNKNDPITLALLFNKGVIAELAMNARYLRELAKDWTEDKESHYPRELLDRLNTRLCKIYDDAHSQVKSKTENIFLNATHANKSVSSRKNLHAIGGKDIKTLEELDQWGKYKPSFARQEIYLMRRYPVDKLIDKSKQEGHFEIQNKELGVYINIDFTTLQDTAKEQLNDEEILENRQRQQEIIKLLIVSRWAFKQLSLAGCEELKNGDLKTILKYSRATLETLNITQCRQITRQALRKLASFHTLREIHASGTAITNVSQDNKKPLSFPNLEVLHLAGCLIEKSKLIEPALKHVYLEAPKLKELKLNDNQQLQFVKVNGANLKTVNLKDTTQLTHLELMSNQLQELNLINCSSLTDANLTVNSQKSLSISLKQCDKLKHGKFRQSYPSLFTALPWQHYTKSFVEKLSTTLDEALTSKGERTNWDKLPLQTRESLHGRLYEWGKVSQEVIPELLIALKDKDSWTVRQAAAQALGQCHALLGPFLDSVIPNLLIALKDNDSWKVRQAAAQALGLCHALLEPFLDSIIPELLIALKDNDYDVRQAAAQALGQCHALLGPFLDSVIPNLLIALKDNDSWTVRQAAARTLGQCAEHDPNSVIPNLLIALKDKDSWTVRQAAARTLGQCAEHDPNSIIPNLLIALKDNNSDVRQAAAQALGQCHALLKPLLDSVIPELLIALKDNDYDVRHAAAQALGQCAEHDPNSIIPNLLIALKDNNSDVRQAAARTLGQCAEHDPNSIIPNLLIALKDNNSDVRHAAAQALGQCAEHDPNSIIPNLLIALKDNNSDVRHAAAQALGQCHALLKPLLDSVIPELLIALKDNDYDVRQAAAQALGQCAEHDPNSVIPNLLIALKDNDSWKVRQAAAQALGQCAEHDPNSVIPNLLIALKDNDSWIVRHAAAQALGLCHALLGPFLDSVIPELLIALKDNDYDVRQAVAQTLGQCHALLGPFLDSVIPNLLIALKDNDSWIVRHAAAQALGQCHALLGPFLDSVIPNLLIALKDKDSWTVRQAVAQTLGQCAEHDPNSVIPNLLIALKDKDSWIVRHAAAQTLGQCAEHDPNSVIPNLLIALKDNDSWIVRHAAAQALGQCAEHDPNSIIPNLLIAFKDNNSDVRHAAAQALGQCHALLKPLLDSVIPELLIALKDNDYDVRQAAARTLEQCAEHDPNSVIPNLLIALKDKDSWTVRQAAARTLGQCAEHDPNSIIPNLLIALKDNNSDVRHAAAQALGQCAEHDPNSVIPNLLIALKDNDSWIVRHAAAQALGTIGSVDTLQSWIKNVFNENKANLESEKTSQQQPTTDNASSYSSDITQQTSSLPAELPTRHDDSQNKPDQEKDSENEHSYSKKQKW